jgi:hypothetical protein
LYGLFTFVAMYGLALKPRRLAGSLTGFSCGLLALQSIGQLSWRDVAVLSPLILVGYLYSYYYGKAPKRSAEA